MPYQSNPGRLPEACLVRDVSGKVTGTRNVHVRLFGGYDSHRAGHAPWPAADRRPPTDWTLSRPPHPFQIREWELA